ncbi:NEL-type E3 ubiquitin ligase domain-containing protein [Bordetella flabilis]|uniref:NEL domain-containing protein n=1 Tax=Bordetella flabilis TaxID=463014 RepID=A0A193GK45_9BORD|nr:NEL-type E3 ubiquitin ligase domain-containing protein [Bordetella flabilis]ANN79958.1 hypothetical protein BAU07_25125 [Bordetella flabilis]
MYIPGVSALWHSIGARPRQDPSQTAGAGYTGLLIAGIQGAASPQQVDDVRTLLGRLQQDPRGKILLSAMQALHAHHGSLPTIVLERAPGLGRPSLARPVAGTTWYLDMHALDNGGITEAVRELAAVYNNMAGAGAAVGAAHADPFQSYTQDSRRRLDPDLEKAWDSWIGAVRTDGRLWHVRRSVVQQLRIDLKERQCHGGLSRDDFASLMRAIQFGRDTPPPWYSPIVIRVHADAPGDHVPDMGPFQGKRRGHPPPAHAGDATAANEAALPENALPPLPDDLPALCLDGIRRPDLRTLPSGLQLLRARNIGISRVPASLPPCLRVLDLSNNDLRDAPQTFALPPTVEVLRLAGNPLAALPYRLPGGLVELDVARTDLPALPALPASQRRLIASDCCLETLPENLPPDLEYIDASRNRIRSLPAHLPLSLRMLDLSSNELDGLPACITRLVSCTINLELNPLSPRDIPRPAAGQPGPRIHYSMTDVGRGGSRRGRPRLVRGEHPHAIPQSQSGAVQASVARWVGGTAPRMAQARARWDALGDLPDSAEFGQLLDRLHTVQAARDAAFRNDVAEWLMELSMPDRKALRDDTFAACAEATTRCEDRVAWTFNQLKALWQNDDIRRGRYDGRVAEVVDVARQMFRLEVLTGIARRKVASMTVVDEIEVYLAYVVQLRNALQLTTVVPEMRFYTVSHVTADDLADALQAVQAREAAEFDAFLALDYEPWQTLLARLLGDRYQLAQQRMQQALETRFEADLRAALLADDVDPDDADARRIAGVAVMRNIRYGVLGPLTRECLRNVDGAPAQGPERERRGQAATAAPDGRTSDRPAHTPGLPEPAYAEPETMVTSL